MLGIGFYGWACFKDIFYLVVYLLLVYLAALFIQATSAKRLMVLIFQERPEANEEKVLHRVSVALMIMTVAVTMVLVSLFIYKYLNFVIKSIHYIFPDSIPETSILSPLGISFITFSAISYLVDVYKRKAPAGSLIDCALYLLFFPKIVSGPIVLWRNFQPQIATRKANLDEIVSGLNRIMIGFAKKLILADMFGACIADIQQAATSGIDVISAWGAVFLYMLQIYYDFSGYSDIAIGLASIFGFYFKENFQFPYCSKSITEFWRRWHISLGSWFREYVYIPLGGNRISKRRTLFNLAVVFILTGIWHGAGWNYILWGSINGIFVLLERIVWKKAWYQKIPGLVKWAGTFFITMMCWEFFRFQELSSLGEWLWLMLGIARPNSIYFTWQYYFDKQMIVLVVIATLGSTVLNSERLKKAYRALSSTKLGFASQELGLLILFGISVLYMVNSTYSPFIYFQY